MDPTTPTSIAFSRSTENIYIYIALSQTCGTLPLFWYLFAALIEENVENGYARGNEERTNETRWKDACQRDLKGSELRTGEETDMAMWRRKIISHTGDLT